MKAQPSFYNRVQNGIRNNFSFIIGIVVFVILIEMLFILVSYDMKIRDQINSKRLPIEYTTQDIASYPVVLHTYEPFLTAQSAVLLDNSSKRVLFSKNPDLRFSMASTTKLMTALVALDYFAYNDVLTVRSVFNQGSIVGFYLGEQIYFDDLLYALLLPSGNDAAHIIAENYPGGVTEFVKKMNEKALAYNLVYTHFADPAGLNDDQNYTTALDLARFSSIALENPTVARIVSTKRKVITDVSGNSTYELENLNQLLGYSGVIGIKTGTTQGAGEVLTTAVRKNQREYIVVVMKSEDRFVDTQNIINLLEGGNIVYRSPGELVGHPTFP